MYHNYYVKRYVGAHTKYVLSLGGTYIIQYSLQFRRFEYLNNFYATARII